MRNRDVIVLLTEWGKWARNGGDSLRAQSASLIVMQLVEPTSSEFIFTVCEDEIMQVEMAVTFLKRNNPTAYELLKYYFVLDWSMRQIKRRMSLSREDADKLFSWSCGWLEARLNIISCVA